MNNMNCFFVLIFLVICPFNITRFNYNMDMAYGI